MRSKNWTFICTALSATFVASAAWAQCGNPAAGDCCAANGTPNCSDLACCELVCSVDPLCCDTQWSQSCADFALALCDPAACGGGGGGGGGGAGCGDPAAGDCCIANGTPGCSDAECCEAVCAADAFCCDTQWDQICANAAVATCGVCGGGGGGGGGGGDGFTCEKPGEFLLGDNAFANGATGIIIDMTGVCAMQFTPEFYNTNYYLFTPAESGFYRMSTCNAADFDTKIAVMNGCDPFEGVLACNDDGAGCAGFTSQIPSVELVGGLTYRIAIGGYAAGTLVGSGNFNIEFLGDGSGGGCEDATEFVVGFNDFDTSTAFTPVDLTGFCDLGAFGDELIYNAVFYRFTPPKSDVYSISTCDLAGFDTRLAVLEGCTPADGVLACNDDGAGCTAFTSEIPFVELEGGIEYYIVVGGFSAADQGFGQVEISSFVPCDLGTATAFEVEFCGEDLNGGCNSQPNLPTEPIALGDIVQGTFWADGGTRDTDWYLLSLAEDTEVTITIRSNIASFAAAVDLGCGGIVGDPTVGECPGTVSVCLPAGDHFIVALPSGFEGAPCGLAVGNEYTLEVTGVPCTAIVCGSPESGDCCFANGTPFCSDAECCDLICAADPFCCNTEWDQICADAAVVSCASCGGGGGGGDGSTCDAPIEVVLGDNAFANGATGNVIDLTGICDMQFTDQIYNTNYYAFTPAENGTYSFSTCDTANFDTKIAILSVCGDPFAGVLACNDDGVGCTGFTSRIDAVDLEGGVTYFVALGGYAAATLPGSGTLTIAISDGPPEPPANDECANAIAVTLGDTAFENFLATGLTNASCVSIDNEIWYTYTAVGDQDITISLCGASYDSAIAVFEGSCDGPEVACNDDSCGLQSQVTFPGTCGTTYVIAVGAFSPAGFGSGTMTISQAGSCAPSCPGDLNGDNEVSSQDLATLLNAWGTPGADLNGDGTTDSQDLAALLNGWGACN